MRNQLRQLSGDTAIYGVSTIVQRFLSFLLTPFYTHVLTRAELGTSTTIFVMISFAMIVANMGMEPAFFRFDASAQGADEKRRVFWSAAGVVMASAFVVALAMSLFPDVVNNVAFLGLDSGEFGLVRLTAVIILLDAASAVPLAAIRMARRAKLFGTIKVLAVFVNVVMNIWLVAVLGMGIKGIFIAGIVQSAVQLLAALPFVLKQMPIRADRATVRTLLAFGLPTIASGLALIALQGIDRPMMAAFTSESTVGLYQAGYRLGIPMMIFVSMFEFAWRPFFLQQSSSPNARQLFARIFTYFNVVTAILFLIAGFFIRDLAAMPIPFTNGRTLIAPNFWEGLVVVPVVLAAYIFSGWYTNFIVGIYIEKRTSALPWITGIGAAIKIALCFLLIPVIGIMGGAWSTFVAYIAMAGVLYLVVQRIYKIEYEWGRVFRIAAATILLWWIGGSLLDTGDRSITATLIRIALVAAFPLLLLISGFFRSDERAELARLSKRFGGRGNTERPGGRRSKGA